MKKTGSKRRKTTARAARGGAARAKRSGHKAGNRATPAGARRSAEVRDFPAAGRSGQAERPERPRLVQVRDCMTEEVELTDPGTSLMEAARKMRDGDFGMLPVGENDRLVGMITDRDIAVRAVAEGKNMRETKIREAMSPKVLYCFDDQSVEEAAAYMGEHQVRRLPVLNRNKRLVGILSLGDLATASGGRAENAGAALGRISEHQHREPVRQERATAS